MKKYSRLGEQTCSTIIHIDDTLELVCIGYRRSVIKTCFFAFFTLITCGFLLLIRRWKPRWTIGLQFSKCPLELADVFLLSNGANGNYVCEVWQIPLESVPLDFYDFVKSCSPLSKPITSLDVTPKSSLIADGCSSLRGFTFRHDKFLWHNGSRKFVALRGVDVEVKCVEILLKYRGWNCDEQESRRRLFGDNCIDVQVKSYWSLLIHEVLNPFYVFQIASLTLWAVDNYFIYAGCILFISLVSITIELFETRKQSETLRDMVSSANNTEVMVKRKEGTFETVSSRFLVPGDVISIPSDGCLMSCDALLLNGSCIVNESMLTGESVPVTKCSLSKSEENDLFSYEHHKKHILFCGTSIIQTRFYSGNKVLALVLRTGFSTAKGELVKDVLFPKPINFKFYRDAMIFVTLLAAVALIGTCYSLYIYIKRGADVQKIIIRGLDIITIVVPPALPAAMTVGIWYAQRRLKLKEIFCISPPRINVCGKLNLICFDKTGTLTEEGLDFQGVLPVFDASFGDLVTEPSVLLFCPLVTSMASCHSLTVINGKLSGDPLDLVMFESTKWELTEPTVEESARYDTIAPAVVRPLGGEPNDDEDEIFSIPTIESGLECVKLRNLVKPIRVVDENDDDEKPLEVGILRQFPFSSTLQRSAVVVRRLGSRSMEIHVKGAPEKIVALCKRDFLPKNFSNVLEAHTKQGHRVIAVAYKILDKKILWHHLQRMKREDLEMDLEFIGLVIFQNKLKSETTPVIDELRKARIVTVMATGDNILTALSVASECGLLAINDSVQIVNVCHSDGEEPPRLEFQRYSVATNDETSCDVIPYESYLNSKLVGANVKYALTGSSFSHLNENFPDLFEKIILNGVVFARMSPHNKSQLVRAYQDLGFIVGMCGDGANDCGALKVAHAGVSLSDSEASVASPFTSRIQNITCVPAIIKEGRCALVTSFGVFKYMAIYSLIQFVSVLILYTVKTNLGDYMFLFIDLFIITSVAFLMGRNEPSEKLVPRRPSSSLLSVQVVLSLTIHLVLLITFQVIALLYLVNRPWYKPNNPKPNQDVYVCWETTTIFFITCYQYLIMAFVFAHGPPYRQPIYKNFWFLFVLILLTVVVTVLVVFPTSFAHKWLDLQVVQYDFWRYKLTIILLASLNLLVCLTFEEYIVYSEFVRRIKKYMRKSQSKARYKCLSNEFDIKP